jgi:hypothetical protein
MPPLTASGIATITTVTIRARIIGITMQITLTAERVRVAIMRKAIGIKTAATDQIEAIEVPFFPLPSPPPPSITLFLLSYELFI